MGRSGGVESSLGIHGDWCARISKLDINCGISCNCDGDSCFSRGVWTEDGEGGEVESSNQMNENAHRDGK